MTQGGIDAPGGGVSGPNISIFLEDRSYLFFVNVGAPKLQLTVIILRNRLKLFYKTIILN